MNGKGPLTNFAYTAIPLASAGAGAISGTRAAADERALRTELRTQGLIAVDVRPVSLLDALRTALGRERLRRSDSVWFFQTLRAMLGGKVPIESAVSTMREVAPNRRLVQAAGDVREALRGGSSLADAVAQCPGLATPQHLALLKSGHDSGRLEHAVGLIEHSLTLGDKARRMIVNRMIYPAMLLVAAVLAVWFLATFVIPKFAETLDALGGKIPWQTRVTMIGARYAAWIVPPLLAVAAVAWSARRALLTPPLRQRLSSLALRTPLVGTLLWHHQAALITDVVATMLEGGGDVLAGMDRAADVVTSPVIVERLIAARRDVREGIEIGEAFHTHQVLPPMLAAIVRVGMKSGDLPGSLRRASEAGVQRSEAISSRLLSLLEPGVIAFLAAVVGWVVYSLVSGMLAMNDATSL